MTERTYGVDNWTIEELLAMGKPKEKELATHIRELQAENAKLKADLHEAQGYIEQCDLIAHAEAQKIKAGRIGD